MRLVEWGSNVSEERVGNGRWYDIFQEHIVGLLNVYY